MSREHKIKSSKRTKIMLKTESYIENKPKYTKYIQNAGPSQRGDLLYVKRRRLFNRKRDEASSL